MYWKQETLTCFSGIDFSTMYWLQSSHTDDINKQKKSIALDDMISAALNIA